MNRCPFCVSVPGVKTESCDYGVEYFMGYCTECGATGPANLIRQAAIEAWNQRAVPPIVWKREEDGCSGAYVCGMRFAGLYPQTDGTCYAHGVGGDNCEPDGSLTDSEEEAKAKVEEKWREAYLEMHR